MGEKEKAKQFTIIIDDFKTQLGMEVEEDPEEIERKVDNFLSDLMKGPIESAQEESKIEVEPEKTLMQQGENILGRLKQLEVEEETVFIDEDEVSRQIPSDIPESPPETLAETEQTTPEIPDAPESPYPPPENIPTPPQPSYPTLENIPNPPPPPPLPQTKDQIPEEHAPINKPPSFPPEVPQNINQLGQEPIAESQFDQTNPLPPETIQQPVQSFNQNPSNELTDQPIAQTQETSDVNLLKESEDIFKRLKKLQGMINEDQETQIKITPVKPVSQTTKKIENIESTEIPEEQPPKSYIPSAEPTPEIQPEYIEEPSVENDSLFTPPEQLQQQDTGEQVAQPAEPEFKIPPPPKAPDLVRPFEPTATSEAPPDDNSLFSPPEQLQPQDTGEQVVQPAEPEFTPPPPQTPEINQGFEPEATLETPTEEGSFFAPPEQLQPQDTGEKVVQPAEPEFTPPPTQTPEINQGFQPEGSDITLPSTSIEEETESLRQELSQIRNTIQERESISTTQVPEGQISVPIDNIEVEEISLNKEKDEKNQLIEMIKKELPKIPKKKINHIVKELLKRPAGKLRDTWFKVYVHKNKKYQ
ncbi:MAG: hypothetical protein EU551_00030 [Promethearchaeota archaeon]|nr:MAG: hypothetical protein EU551_00030 [Candidatus Lokiarchaeota archaeon]